MKTRMGVIGVATVLLGIAVLGAFGTVAQGEAQFNSAAAGFGRVQGLVVAQSASGRTWSLGNQYVRLLKLDPDAMAFWQVDEQVIGNDNSFTFENVPDGDWYMNQIESADWSYGGPCDTPILFSVAAGRTTRYSTRCYR